jgi:hypothetical protein
VPERRGPEDGKKVPQKPTGYRTDKSENVAGTPGIWFLIRKWPRELGLEHKHLSTLTNKVGKIIVG